MPENDETIDRPELIFGLVGAAGARLEDLSREIKDELATFGYDVVEVRLSGLLRNAVGWFEQKGTSEADRIRHYQDRGDAFRRSAEDGAALARAAIVEIRVKRASITGNPDRPASAHAYILHQLKHPDEVDLLRHVYGPAFLLAAGHAPLEDRALKLAERMAQKDTQVDVARFQADAHDVISRDEKQDDDYGQNTRDTYPKADFFADLGNHREFEVRRFVDLVFGNPFNTPSPEEYAMYQASAASLRSSDYNRQVGAAIVSLARDAGRIVKSADIVAVGMNEVPRGGGGYYWYQHSPDRRDQKLIAEDPNDDRPRKIKISALAELIDKIRQQGWLRSKIAKDNSSELARQLLGNLKRTQFMDFGEFSRPVHAEMAALIDAARRGVAVSGLTMYVTTFPCHNCIKHIIAAGLRRVVYLEPYPKSMAINLHGEEIVLESIDGIERDDKVSCCAFSGIAPRQYRQLFSMSERGAKQGRSLTDWNSNKLLLSPLYVMRNASLSYVATEREELEKLPPEIYHYDKETAVPVATAEKPA